jgi:hypothetical protein
MASFFPQTGTREHLVLPDKVHKLKVNLKLYGRHYQPLYLAVAGNMRLGTVLRRFLPDGYLNRAVAQLRTWETGHPEPLNLADTMEVIEHLASRGRLTGGRYEIMIRVR